MSAAINVVTVQFQNNPTPFLDGFKVEMTFESESLQEDLEWDFIYVGSPLSTDFDQVLESVVVGPVIEGRHRFVIDTKPPDPAKIPPADLIGATAVLLKGSYRKKEFINIGWFVACEYADPEIRDDPPSVPAIEKLQLRICTEDIRVTTYQIQWDGSSHVGSLGVEGSATNEVDDSDQSIVNFDELDDINEDIMAESGADEEEEDESESGESDLIESGDEYYAKDSEEIQVMEIAQSTQAVGLLVKRNLGQELVSNEEQMSSIPEADCSLGCLEAGVLQLVTIPSAISNHCDMTDRLSNAMDQAMTLDVGIGEVNNIPLVEHEEINCTRENEKLIITPECGGRMSPGDNIGGKSNREIICVELNTDIEMGTN